MLGEGVGVPAAVAVGMGFVGAEWGAKGLGKTLVNISTATIPMMAKARVARPQLARGRSRFHPLEIGGGAEAGCGIACAFAALHSSISVTVLLSITWSPTDRACGAAILVPFTVIPFMLPRSSMTNHSS